MTDEQKNTGGPETPGAVGSGGGAAASGDPETSGKEDSVAYQESGDPEAPGSQGEIPGDPESPSMGGERGW
jgi:hypothetical protein